MTICYFGIYSSEYSRNRILIKGLKLNGVHIIECQSNLNGIKKYFDLISKHHKLKRQYDLMIVGFPGQQSMILAKFLTNKKIVFDAFTSLYDSLAFDRKIVRPRSIRATYYWLLDWLSCRLADKILLDTNEHIKYFSETFRISKDKFCRLFVGSDNEVIKPVEPNKKEDGFLVHFHGSCIPLQGVEYILEAASILEKKGIEFNIIGSRIKNRYKNFKTSNINFIDDIPYEKLKYYMSSADVCLGIFGKTDKAQRVIPNKIFEALAAQCPVITGETLAVKELFVDRENILFCKMGDAKDLGNKILEIKNNFELREKIAKNGYNLFINNLTPKHIVGGLLNII